MAENPSNWLSCPNCGATSPREGLLDRVKVMAARTGYPFDGSRKHSDDELMLISCDMTKRIKVTADGKLKFIEG